MRKSWISFLLAGLMVVSLCSCGIKVKNTGDDKQEKGTRASVEVPESTTSTERPQTDGPVLPENFDNMEDALLSLMVQQHVNGYSYYGTDTEGKNPTAFFASMAVLTSLMEDKDKDDSTVEKDGYYYISEETFNMYATALFADYGTNLEAPEISEDDQFVKRDDDTETFGFIKGHTRMGVNVTGSESEGDGYRLSLELLSAESEPVAHYEALIVPTTFEGSNNQFAYSVKELLSDGSDDNYDFDQNTEEDTSDEEATTSSTEDTEEDSSNVNTREDDEETANDYEENGSTITEDEARKKLEDNYGKGDYDYQGTEKIGNKDYYNYQQKDEDGNTKNYLISTDGEDSISGKKNEDGSWSMDE